MAICLTWMPSYIIVMKILLALAEVGRYISKSLKEKITIEAQGLNLIEKGGKLPL